jgi:hypothetical protein
VNPSVAFGYLVSMSLKNIFIAMVGMSLLSSTRVSGLTFLNLANLTQISYDNDDNDDDDYNDDDINESRLPLEVSN